MINKKEFITTLKERNDVALTQFLFENPMASVETYYNLATERMGSVWVGDYLYQLIKKNKINEEDVFYLSTLTDKKKVSWIEYISDKELLCIRVLNLFIQLAKENKLSIKVFDLLFTIDSSGKILVLSLIKSELLAKKFFQLINSLVTSGSIDIVLKKFMELPVGNEEKPVIHWLGYYQNNMLFETCLDYFTELLDKDLISADETLSLISLTTEKEQLTTLNTLLLDSNDGAVIKTLIMLKHIFEKKPELLPKIINLLNHKDCTGRTVFYWLLIDQFIPKLEELVQTLFQQNNNNLLIILTLLVDESSKRNYFRKLTKNDQIASLNSTIINMIKVFIQNNKEKLAKQSSILPLNELLELNRNGSHYFHLLLKSPQPEALVSDLFYIVDFYLSVENNLETYLSKFFTELNGWMIFHLIARYQNDKINVLFFNLIGNKLRENTFHIFIPYLDQLLTDDNAKPFYLHLLKGNQPDQTFINFLNAIKRVVLADRLLSLKMLNGILLCKEVNNFFQFEFIRNFVAEIMEKNSIYNVETFSLEEKECLETYSKENFPISDYLLYLHYDALDNSRTANKFLEKAAKAKYDLACIRQCSLDLKQPYLINSVIFSKFLPDAITPLNLVDILNRKRSLVEDEDYLRILTESLKIFQNNLGVIYLALGNFYYATNNRAFAKTYFDKLIINWSGLSFEDLYQLSIIYSHFFVDNNVKDLYLSNRYYQLACLSGFKNERDTHEELLLNSLADFPFLNDIAKFENMADRLIDEGLKQHANNVRITIVDNIMKAESEGDLKAISNICSMLYAWLNTSTNITSINNLFSELSTIESKASNIKFFTLFKPQSEMMKAIKKLYQYITHHPIETQPAVLTT